MAFGDFTFPQVLHDLGLTAGDADLFSQVPPYAPRPEFLATLADGAAVALAINTEKGRSEFIIAPILLELRRLLGGAVGLFSGNEFDVDSTRGLNGVCDFILTRGPTQIVLTAPVVTIVEAKNDNLRNGLGQCIAAMFAAALFNQQEGSQSREVFGVVTTGSAWKFLRLEGSIITVDWKEYYVDDPGKFLGILKNVLETVR